MGAVFCSLYRKIHYIKVHYIKLCVYLERFFLFQTTIQTRNMKMNALNCVHTASLSDGITFIFGHG